LGIRVSLEGLPAANDELRGIKDGFDHGLRTLLRLDRMGIKDIGVAITLSDENADDLVDLYRLARSMGWEFASAAVHNSFYFHHYDNKIERVEHVTACIARLVDDMLASRSVKDWFRAYFNQGLIQYVRGRPRLLACRMGYDAFFLDPAGRVLPCNVMEEPMGDLRTDSFEQIWTSPRAWQVRSMVRRCRLNCWMMGSVSEQMKKHLPRVAWWVIRNKLLGRSQREVF